MTLMFYGTVVNYPLEVFLDISSGIIRRYERRARQYLERDPGRSRPDRGAVLCRIQR
jgi:hypothetical protein